MYRLNLISRVSKYILSSVDFIRSTTNARRNAHIYRNILVKPSRFTTVEKCRFHASHKSQKRRYTLFAVSLPTLILNFLFDIENTEEEVPEVIMTIKRSILLIQKGEFNKAEQMLHVALRQAQTIEHYDAVTYIYDVMANLAFDREDYKKADKLFVSVLQRLMSNGATEDDMRVIHISLKMAKVYESQKDIKKAELGYKFCMDNLKSRIERDAEDINVVLLQAMTFDWYAGMLLSQSLYKEAFNYYLEAYNTCKKIYGEEHEQTVVLLNALATAKYKQGELDEAIKYLSDAVQIGEKVSDIAYLGVVYVNLGTMLLEKGLYKKGGQLCQKGRKIAKKNEDNNILLEADECLKEVKRLLSL